ncbi:MAG TPA: glycosyltransferase family 39 protein, partial [Rhodocyclaceae bacterium]|nr:glycosyltransferase family 39 protein [Rhodocyclaceae bacterium]
MQEDPQQADEHRAALGRLALILGGLVAIAAAACALYLPFLDNKLVFDDATLFSTLKVFDFAQTPFNLSPRTFPYFTLGFVQVTWGGIEANRLVSLALHLCNAFLIYRLARLLVGRLDGVSATRAAGLALLAAAIFALHPVAVYGAAYLVQRTILFATLFSLLSVWFYLRGLARERYADAITAALFYGLAVFSKQHAIMVPAAAVVFSPLVRPDWRQHWRRAAPYLALYLALCAPSGIWVVLVTKGIVGTMYEIDADAIAAQMGPDMALGSPLERWFVSAVTQAGLFFEYLRLWFAPDVGRMSIDLRVDFAAAWTWPLIALRIGAFLACLPACLWLLRRRGRAALFGAGL